jgi:hypothetical protein
MLAFLGYLVGEGCVKQVELCMLMVGHTHEDIDQTFCVITEELKRRRVIRDIADYMDAIESAWKV